MVSRRRFVETLAGAVAGAVTLPEALLFARETIQADEPSSVVLVRRNEQGDVVLRYVRGVQPYAEGSYVIRDVPVALPRQTGADPKQLSQPSAVRHPQTGRTHVARAIINSAMGRTAIHVISSTHPTMLAEAIPAIAVDRPVVIDSPVVFSHFADTLLLTWQEGATLKCVSSPDGATWSTVRSLADVPQGERFALWSEGNAIYLASTTNALTRIVIRESTDAITWTTEFPTPGMYECTAGNPFCLGGTVTGLSIASSGNHVFVAYTEGIRLRIARFRKGPIALNFRSLVVSVVRQQTNPSPQYHGVALHPSAYGWSLLFVSSFTDGASSSGRSYYTGGLRSTDGLDYTGTEWSYAKTPSLTGSPSLVTTAVPMPWIVKTHDSGRPTDAVYNFIVTADGYTYQDKDELLALCKQMTANITDRAPFFHNPDLFNVWAVLTYSKDHGINADVTDTTKDTILGGYMSPPNVRMSRRDGISHARLLITGNRSAPNCYGWVFFTQAGYVAPWDGNGVPIYAEYARSDVVIHEYMHTLSGGFNFGDHERHLGGPGKIANKSFDGSFSPTGAHAWQDWFVFGGTAPSRLVKVTDAYRAGEAAWVAAGNPSTSYVPYSTNPASPFYVDALSLFNPGLWESELWDGITSLDANPLYTTLRACMMNSLLHLSWVFCPICSQRILEHLHTVAGVPFTLPQFRNAPGAFLEFQLSNERICGQSALPPALTLDGLVVVNGHPLNATDFFTYQCSTIPTQYAVRVNITAWVTAGSPATIEFKQRATGETRLWIPGMQLLNSKGARYEMHPVDYVLPSGTGLLARLHQKHAPVSKFQTAVGCDYEYWDLAEGDLVVTFSPK